MGNDNEETIQYIKLRYERFLLRKRIGFSPNDILSAKLYGLRDLMRKVGFVFASIESNC